MSHEPTSKPGAVRLQALSESIGMTDREEQMASVLAEAMNNIAVKSLEVAIILDPQINPIKIILMACNLVIEGNQLAAERAAFKAAQVTQ